jgi:hypothetical protein
MKRTKVFPKKPTTETSQSEPLQSEPDNSSIWQDPFVHILIILAAGFLVYFNTMSVPFIFDDYLCLVNNPAIKSFDCFPDTRKVFDFAINPDIKNNFILRPVSYFTFAFNYALHGLNLFGYHLVNLLLHISCAILVYYLSTQLLMISVLADREESNKASEMTKVNMLSLFTALLFVCHPVQTQAVTYIIQRFVPLTTFFYLAALVLYVQFRNTSTQKLRLLFYALSLSVTILAMESKEIAFTLPVMITMLEFIFLSGKIGPRIVRLIPFFLTMAIIPFKLLHLPSQVAPENAADISGAINLVNFKGTSSWDYLMTQFSVITTYIRLLFLPIGQNFDYDIPLQKHFFSMSVLLPFLLLLIIAGTGIYLLRHSGENRHFKIIAFGIFWFFIALSVESSIVPIDDLIYEHRVYLPSIGFFIALLSGVSVIHSRLTGKSIANSNIATFALAALVLCLSTGSILRNKIWSSESTLWEDTVKKSPKKARVHIEFGRAIIKQTGITIDDKEARDASGFQSIINAAGFNKVDFRTIKNVALFDKAIIEFKEAIRLAPGMLLPYANLAVLYMHIDKFPEADQMLLKAEDVAPTSFIPHCLRGELLEYMNNDVEARQEYLTAIKLEPFAQQPRINLSNLYAKKGNTSDAINVLEILMKVSPSDRIRNKIEALKTYDGK